VKIIFDRAITGEGLDSRLYDGNARDEAELQSVQYGHQICLVYLLSFSFCKLSERKIAFKSLHMNIYD
jgi:hypothetical protein